MRRTGVLVLSTLGVGDVLLAQPLLEALRTSTPERLVVVARRGSPAWLVRRFGCADQVVDYPARWPHRAGFGAWLLAWVSRQRFRLVVATTGLNPYYAAAVALASAAPERVFEHRGVCCKAWTRLVEHPPSAHVVERNHALGRAAGVNPGLVPRFSPTPQEVARAHALLPATGPLVALAPGSNRSIAHKRWPLDRFATLATHLARRGVRTVALGGPDEVGMGRVLAETVGGNMLTDLVGKTDVGTAAAVLRRCRAAVGNDGMLLHLACAVGTPAVAIFGPSDPRRYGPLHPQAVVVTSSLSCSPCDETKKGGCRQRPCLTGLPVDPVLSAVERLLERDTTQGNLSALQEGTTGVPDDLWSH